MDIVKPLFKKKFTISFRSYIICPKPSRKTKPTKRQKKKLNQLIHKWAQTPLYMGLNFYAKMIEFDAVNTDENKGNCTQQPQNSKNTLPT